MTPEKRAAIEALKQRLDERMEDDGIKDEDLALWLAVIVAFEAE